MLFSDDNGNVDNELDLYRESAEAGIWQSELSRPARAWFTRGFAVKNVIPNVGGAVFRRQNLPSDVWMEAERYSILGDWYLYVHLAGGGQICWTPKAISYLRRRREETFAPEVLSSDYDVERRNIMNVLRRRWSAGGDGAGAHYDENVPALNKASLKANTSSIETSGQAKSGAPPRRNELHILIGFLGFHPGGGEFFPIHLANALRGEGILVSMMALDLESIEHTMLDMLDPSIPVYSASYVEEMGVDRFIEEAGISLVHSHMLAVEWLLIGKHSIDRQTPYLVSLHGSYEAIGVEDGDLLKILRTVDHFVLTAEKNLSAFAGLPLNPALFSRMRNAVALDPRPFPKSREELGIPANATIFTFVARGIKEKGWDVAIDAFCKLRENSSQPMCLLMCGEGPEVDLQKARVGDDADILFLGYQSCISGLYRMTDCALVPTRFPGESFPLCIIQALQAGTPVVATRIGEIEQMLVQTEGVAGILLKNTPDSRAFTEELYEAMRIMLSENERASYAQVAASAGRNYDMQGVACQYLAIYERLAHKDA